MKPSSKMVVGGLASFAAMFAPITLAEAAQRAIAPPAVPRASTLVETRGAHQHAPDRRGGFARRHDPPTNGYEWPDFWSGTTPGPSPAYAGGDEPGPPPFFYPPPILRPYRACVKPRLIRLTSMKITRQLPRVVYGTPDFCFD